MTTETLATELPDPGDIDGDLGRIGRTYTEPPFAKVGHWVLMADISNTAVRLYGILVAHVSATRSDFQAWPLQEDLACWLGLSRGGQVRKFVDELVTLGAVEVSVVRTHNGLRRRNVYTVHLAPPDDWSGHHTFSEFYAARKAASTTGSTANPQVSPTTSRDVVRSASQDVVPTTSQDVINKKNLNKKNLNKKNSSVRPVANAGASDPVDNSTEPERTDGDVSPINNHDLARELVGVLDLSRLGPRLSQTSALIRRVAVALDRQPADLVGAYLAGKAGEADTTTYLVQAFTDERIEDIPVLANEYLHPDRVYAGPVALPEVCGQCDARPGEGAGARFVEGDGRQQRCPRCHPSMIPGPQMAQGAFAAVGR